MSFKKAIDVTDADITSIAPPPPVPTQNYFTALRDSGLVEQSAGLNRLCAMEVTGELGRWQRAMFALLRAKHTNRAVEQAMYAISSPHRIKSAGKDWWADIACAMYIGRTGGGLVFAKDDNGDVVEVSGPDAMLYDPDLVVAAPILGPFFEVFDLSKVLPERPGEVGYQEDDFDAAGRMLRLVWASGGLCPGLRKSETWGEREWNDVDCAFGLVCAARSLTFNHRTADEALAGMPQHVEVRWGKLTFAALYKSIRAYYGQA